MRLRDQPAQIRVSLRGLGEQDELRPVAQRDCRAGDRLDAKGLRGVRERERAVNAVAIGQREGRVPEAVCFGEELVRRCGSIQKRESRVAMKLCVGSHGVCMDHSPVTRSSKSTTRVPPSNSTAK